MDDGRVSNFALRFIGIRFDFLSLVPRPSSFIICLLFLITGCATYNPATGRNELIFIGTDTEIMLGDDFHRQISSQYKFSQEAVKTDRLKRIGQRLAQVSDRQDYAYQFFLIEHKELNAFTIPGGRIYLFSGLYDRLKTDDQIAAVLAHEIGHCAARHTIKKFQAALGYNALMNIALGRIGSEGARQVASISANTIMNLASSAYGRRDEYEADRLGLKYMHLAGHDLEGMIQSFQILEQESKGSRPPLILSTHPYIDDRITAVRNEIPKIQQAY